MCDVTRYTLLGVLEPQPTAKQRVPPIVNFNFLPDMGRMDGQW